MSASAEPAEAVSALRSRLSLRSPASVSARFRADRARRVKRGAGAGSGRLGLAVNLRLDGLAATMSLIVAVVGVTVIVYAARYFARDAPDLGRLAGLLVLSGGSMLGFVQADHVLVLYMSWELTSITSFLLISDRRAESRARAAARHADAEPVTSGSLRPTARSCGGSPEATSPTPSRRPSTPTWQPGGASGWPMSGLRGPVPADGPARAGASWGASPPSRRRQLQPALEGPVFSLSPDPSGDRSAVVTSRADRRRARARAFGSAAAGGGGGVAR